MEHHSFRGFFVRGFTLAITIFPLNPFHQAITQTTKNIEIFFSIPFQTV